MSGNNRGRARRRGPDDGERFGANVHQKAQDNCTDSPQLPTGSIVRYAEPLNREDFVYGGAAQGGVNHRNQVLLVTEYWPPPGVDDCYLSLRRFSRDLALYAANNPSPTTGKPPSVAGYSGPSWAPCLPFDLDCALEPEQALKDARKLVRMLVSDFDVGAGAVSLYFSGLKGFHVELPGGLFGECQPDRETAARLRWVAEALARIASLRTVDFSIYKTVHLWRVVNTRHGRSGLFKVRLSVEEILTLDIAAIRALATAPRELETVAPNERLLRPELRDLWERSARAAVDSHQPRAVSSPPRRTTGLQEEQRLLEKALEKVNVDGAGRNDSGLWLAAQLRDAGVEGIRARDTMKRFMERVPKPPGRDHRYTFAEATAILRQAYRHPAREPARATKNRASEDRKRRRLRAITAAFPLNDIGNAERLVAEYGKRIRHVEGWG
jgi:hypothetical protein